MPDTISVAFTPTPVAAGESLAIYATRPISAGRTNMPKGEFRLIQVAAPAAASPIDIRAAYQAIYGSITGLEGMQVLCRVKIISAAGWAGDFMQASAIIT